MKKILIVVVLLLGLILVFFIGRGSLARNYNIKGLVSFNDTNFIDAEKYFSKAVFLKGNFAEAIINLIKSQLAQDELKLADENLSNLISKFPELAETLGLEGEILVLKNEYRKAIPKLTTAIESDSLLAYAYFYRAIAYANLGMLVEAANDYTQAQKKDQSNTEALKEGAIVYSKLENFNAAIQNYNLILELEPSNTLAYLQRGNFKMNIGDYTNALEDFNVALMLDSKLAEAYFNRGKSYAQTGKYILAIVDFQEASDLNFKTVGANYNSGLASLKLSKLEDARKYLELSIKLDTIEEKASQAYHLLGIISMMKQQNSASIEYFNKSIELDNSFADSYYNRGIAHGILKQYEMAIKDLEKTLQLGKTSADVYYALGIQKISLNYTDEGCKDMAKAEEMGHAKASEMRAIYCSKH